MGHPHQQNTGYTTTNATGTYNQNVGNGGYTTQTTTMPNVIRG